MIKFSLVVKQHDGVGLDVDDLQAKDAVDEAIRGANELGSTPGVVSELDFVVKHQDTSASC